MVDPSMTGGGVRGEGFVLLRGQIFKGWGRKNWLGTHRARKAAKMSARCSVVREMEKEIFRPGNSCQNVRGRLL